MLRRVGDEPFDELSVINVFLGRREIYADPPVVPVACEKPVVSLWSIPPSPRKGLQATGTFAP